MRHISRKLSCDLSRPASDKEIGDPARVSEEEKRDFKSDGKAAAGIETWIMI